jgi:hypothetical protein
MTPRADSHACLCGDPQALQYLLFQNTLLHSLWTLGYQRARGALLLFASLTWEVRATRVGTAGMHARWRCCCSACTASAWLILSGPSC